MTRSPNLLDVIQGSLIAGLLLLTSAVSSAATTSDVQNYEATYPELSNEDLLRQVVKGNELAQHEWGNRLALGQSGLPKNVSAAAMWYSRAAQRGVPGSASLSTLANAPIRIDRTLAANTNAGPTAQLAASTDSAYALARTIDGTASADSDGIALYIWDAWSEDDSLATPTLTDLGSGQAQVIFPNAGEWFVTLIVMDASGQIDHQTQSHTILEAIPIIPVVPAVTSPTADTIIQASVPVSYSWLLSDTAQSYDFEIFTEAVEPEDAPTVIASQLLSTENCDTTSCSVSAAINAVAGSEIFWRVRSTNTAGSSEWQESRVLVVAQATSAPLTPVVISPASYSELNAGGTTEFTWEHEEQVETYEFYFYNNDPDGPRGSVEPFTTGLRAFDLCEAGTCSYTVAVDLPIYDRHIWRVRAINSIDESSWSKTYFDAVEPVYETPVVPELLTPENMTLVETGDTVKFTWTKSLTASAYELEIVDPANPAQDVVSAFKRDSSCGSEQCTLYIDIDLPLSNTYEWKVRAINAAGGSDYSMRNFSVIEPATLEPTVLSNISPQVFDDLVIGTDVLFQWVQDENAVIYEFHLSDSQDSDYLSQTVELLAGEICTDSTCSYTKTIDVAVGTYHSWRVTGTNSLGEVSERFFFNAIEPYTEAPAVFALLTPLLSEDILLGTSATFTWQSAERAESYEISLPGSDGTPSLTTVFTNSCDNSVCSYATTIDYPIGDDYTWHVTAANSVGQTVSEVSTFSVVSEIIIPPEAPSLLSPAANQDFDAYKTIEFSWQPVADATSYEFYLTDGINGAQPVMTDLSPDSLCTTETCVLSLYVDFQVSSLHSWHVRTKRDDTESSWTQRGFAIAAPPAPTLLSPVAAAEFENDSTIDFQWQAVSDATSYDFYINDGLIGVQPSLVDLLASEYCIEDICTLSVQIDLSTNSAHSWHVRTNRQDITSIWAERAFAVVPPTEPVALFSMLGFNDSNATGPSPLSITFDPAESSDDEGIVSYTWDFGLGGDAVEVDSPDTQTIEYDTVGTYTVTLTVTDTAGLTHVKTSTVTVLGTGTPATLVDSSRLLAQASFGPTRASLEQVQSMGVENWLDWQMSLEGPEHYDYLLEHAGGTGDFIRHEIWWADAVEGEDQLRQRVAFALSQIFVISGTGFTLGNSQDAITVYYDMLRNHAFANFRDLLEEVTLSPVMGIYLSMLQNSKGNEEGTTRADENFAREVLQLFTIGLFDLNLDGSTDGSPSFNQDQIEAFARVFTGWNYADAGRWDRGLTTGADKLNQMLPFEEYHDTDAKILLNGLETPAGNSARQDLDLALDNIFNHANVGPFISKQLIKRFVTSNPSPAYVERIATVFNDNGEGVRGDLGAVVRALMLDTEARSIPSSLPYYGKLREPVLRLTHLWRAFDVQRGTTSSVRNEFNTVSPQLYNLESVTGQAVLRSPSVFNFFQPSYSPAGPIADANLDAPEFELFTAGNELETSNRIGRQIQLQYAGNPVSSGQTKSYLDFSYELTIADDVDELLEHLNILLLSGNMTDGLRTILAGHLNTLTTSDDDLSQRVRDAVTLIMASPDYLVQM